MRGEPKVLFWGVRLGHLSIVAVCLKKQAACLSKALRVLISGASIDLLDEKIGLLSALSLPPKTESRFLLIQAPRKGSLVWLTAEHRKD